MISLLYARLFGGARQLREANERLRQEVAAHEATLRELQGARQQLEQRVAARTKELSLITARFETALRGAHVTVFTQDRSLRYTSISNAMLGTEVGDILGRTDQEFLPEGSQAVVIALKRQVLETGEPRDGEVSIIDGASTHWFDLHIEPSRDVTGAIVGITGAAVDITERKEGEAHLRLLLRELTHRSKNLLAVIQAMARQTARHSGSIERFMEQFAERLQALAASHDLLVQESWYGASLHELVRAQLGPLLDGDGGRVAVDGPGIVLKPEAAQSLGLAIHELVDNAKRYGALSVPSGHVSLSWRRREPGQGGGLEVSWAEDGGPGVPPPERRGFGRLVIERNLAGSAEVDLAFPPEGVRCRVLIPEGQISAAR